MGAVGYLVGGSGIHRRNRHKLLLHHEAFLREGACHSAKGPGATSHTLARLCGGTLLDGGKLDHENAITDPVQSTLHLMGLYIMGLCICKADEKCNLIPRVLGSGTAPSDVLYDLPSTNVLQCIPIPGIDFLHRPVIVRGTHHILHAQRTMGIHLHLQKDW